MEKMITIQIVEKEWERVQTFLGTENIPFQTLPNWLPTIDQEGVYAFLRLRMIDHYEEKYQIDFAKFIWL